MCSSDLFVSANDTLFQPLAETNSLLEEVKPVSKDLSALGEAGLKLLDYLAPLPPAPEERSKKVKKPGKSELAARKAAQDARAAWLVSLNAELERMMRPPARGTAAGQAPSAEVFLAACRPVKALADALHP